MGCSGTKSNSAYTQITDKLSCGSHEAVKDKELLKQNKITHILLVGNDEKPFPDDFQYLYLKVNDGKNEKMDEIFSEAVKFLKNGENVFVSCLKGLSRAVIFTAAYIMYSDKCDSETALKKIKDKKEESKPNPELVIHLKDFEKFLKENNYEL